MVAFDAVATGGGFPPGSISVNHALGAGSGNNRVVLAGVLGVGPSPHTFSVNSYNSVAMTPLTQITASIFGRITSLTVFYLLDANLPTTAGNYTFTATYSGAYEGRVIVASYTDVSQVVPFNSVTFTDSGNTLSGTYSTNITPNTSSGFLVDFSAHETNALTTATPNAGQTEIADIGDNDSLLVSSYKSYSTNAPNSMGWTPATNYYTVCHRIIELANVAVAGGNNAPFFGTNF